MVCCVVGVWWVWCSKQETHDDEEMDEMDEMDEEEMDEEMDEETDDEEEEIKFNAFGESVLATRHPFRIGKAKGKGQGTFSNIAIKKKTVICESDVLLVMSEKAFNDELNNSAGRFTGWKLPMSNGLTPVDDYVWHIPGDRVAVDITPGPCVPEWVRFNHSSSKNCKFIFDWKKHTIRIVTTRFIACGEELLVTYSASKRDIPSHFF